MAKRSECNDPTCGCHLPTLQDPVQALEFLLGRFRFAGVAEGVAERYADDIEEILKDYEITFKKREPSNGS